MLPVLPMLPSGHGQYHKWLSPVGIKNLHLQLKLLLTLHCHPLACTRHSWWDNSLQMPRNWSQQPRFVWETGSRWCHQFILSLVVIMQTSQTSSMPMNGRGHWTHPDQWMYFLWENPPPHQILKKGRVWGGEISRCLEVFSKLSLSNSTNMNSCGVCTVESLAMYLHYFLITRYSSFQEGVNSRFTDCHFLSEVIQIKIGNCASLLW